MVVKCLRNQCNSTDSGENQLNVDCINGWRVTICWRECVINIAGVNTTVWIIWLYWDWLNQSKTIMYSFFFYICAYCLCCLSCELCLVNNLNLKKKKKGGNIPVSHDTHHQVAKNWANKQGELGNMDLPSRVTDQIPLKTQQDKKGVLVTCLEKMSPKKHHSLWVPFFMSTETLTVMWMSAIKWEWQKEKKQSVWDCESESTLTEINSFSSAHMGQWTHRCSAQHLKHSQGHTCGSTECSASHAQPLEMYPMQLPQCSGESHHAGPPFERGRGHAWLLSDS